MGQTAGRIPPASRSSAEIARTLAETAGRRRAVIIAGHSGEVDVALAGIDDEAPEVRASALHSLQRLGRLTRPMIDAAVADPAPKVRHAAALVAGAWGDGGDHGGPIDLLPLLHDPAPEVVEVAAWACGEGASDDDDAPPHTAAAVIEELIRLTTSHEDALVREAAVAALGAIGDIRGLPAIVEATTDKATVRRRAVIALAPFDGDEVDKALQRALDDHDWQVRQAAEDLLE